MKNKDFEKLFFSKTRDFLDEYLTKQCSRSLHTVKAYRDALTVFRKYVSMHGLPLKASDCCTSIDKSRKFLSDLTEGKLNLSKSMVSRLSREFACKTEQERRTIFSDLLLSPVMHTDCTNVKVNGASAYVFICVSHDGKAPYFAREKKGTKV